MWHAVLHEIHNGTVRVCLQRDDDWEGAEVFASFTELEQDESPESVERWFAQAAEEAAARNACELRAELRQSVPGPKDSIT